MDKKKRKLSVNRLVGQKAQMKLQVVDIYNKESWAAECTVDLQ